MLLLRILILNLLSVYFACNQYTTSENKTKVSVFESSTKSREKDKDTIVTKISEISLPKGYERIAADAGSFAYYLQNLPIKTDDNTIYSYDGSVISEGGYHHSIIDIDIGKMDLQQCADAIMRLRAEYLYQKKEYKKIHFNFLSDGKPRYYNTYCKGDRSYKKFRKYLNYIFSYANSSSLCDEMLKVDNINDMKIGDCFVQKGHPIGHAVIVVDMAVNKKTGAKIFMLAQSFMPAQSIHILSNLNDSHLDPWYPLSFEGDLVLPVWTFYKKDLRRFK